MAGIAGVAQASISQARVPDSTTYGREAGSIFNKFFDRKSKEDAAREAGLDKILAREAGIRENKRQEIVAHDEQKRREGVAQAEILRKEAMIRAAQEKENARQTAISSMIKDSTWQSGDQFLNKYLLEKTDKAIKDGVLPAHEDQTPEAKAKRDAWWNDKSNKVDELVNGYGVMDGRILDQRQYNSILGDNVNDYNSRLKPGEKPITQSELLSMMDAGQKLFGGQKLTSAQITAAKKENDDIAKRESKENYKLFHLGKNKSGGNGEIKSGSATGVVNGADTINKTDSVWYDPTGDEASDIKLKQATRDGVAAIVSKLQNGTKDTEGFGQLPSSMVSQAIDDAWETHMFGDDKVDLPAFEKALKTYLKMGKSSKFYGGNKSISETEFKARNKEIEDNRKAANAKISNGGLSPLQYMKAVGAIDMIDNLFKPATGSEKFTTAPKGGPLRTTTKPVVEVKLNTDETTTDNIDLSKIDIPSAFDKVVAPNKEVTLLSDYIQNNDVKLEDPRVPSEISSRLGKLYDLDFNELTSPAKQYTNQEIAIMQEEQYAKDRANETMSSLLRQDRPLEDTSLDFAIPFSASKMANSARKLKLSNKIIRNTKQLEAFENKVGTGINNMRLSETLQAPTVNRRGYELIQNKSFIDGNIKSSSELIKRSNARIAKQLKQYITPDKIAHKSKDEFVKAIFKKIKTENGWKNISKAREEEIKKMIKKGYVLAK